MIIESCPRAKNFPAVLAGVGEGAGEVDILHVFPQIEPPVLDNAAESAAMSPRTVRTLLYIGVQAPHSFYKN
jgi:hypothetical protein